MYKKIIITVGGTGGHIYPALSLAKQILARHPDFSVLFVGGGLKSNRYFSANEFSYEEVTCGSFSGKNPWKLLKGIGRIIKGFWQSRKVIRHFRPNIIVGFGSYYTFPLLLAGKWQKIPIVLHEANSIPGRVNSLLSPYVHMTAIHFPETGTLLKGETIEVGMPLREGFKNDFVSKEEARTHFDLAPDVTTVLVFGGSQGAQTLNRLVEKAAAKVKHSLNSLPFQILHLTGDPMNVTILKDQYQSMGIRSCVKAFEQHMNFAWQAADLVISRSGAGTIAELLEFEVPGILIPYPHAKDKHQHHNAHFLVDLVKGALFFDEEDLTVEKLAGAWDDLLRDVKKRETMQQSMQAYKLKARPLDLCGLVESVLLETEIKK